MASVVQLADEVLVGVLSWLSADGLVLSRQVCQDWLRVADDDLLWRPLVTSRWQVLPKDEAWAAQLGGPGGWRGLYIFKHRFDQYWDHQVSMSWKLVEDPLRLTQTDQCAMAVLDDYVYLFGGRMGQVASSDLWVYSASKGKKLRGIVMQRPRAQYSTADEWPAGRIYSNAAVTEDRYLYVFGGSGDWGALFNELWVFDTVTHRWKEVEATGDPPQARWTQSVTAVGKRLFVFGGWTHDANFNDLHIFDTETKQWSIGEMKGDIPPPLGCHTASLVGKYIFIYGGDDAQLHIYHDIYRLDTESLVIEKLAIKGELQPERRESHDGVVVGNHIIYYSGQRPQQESGDVPYPVEARQRGTDIAIFNTDALTWHHPRIKGGPVGLNWHKLSFVGNKIQVWFGATEDPLPSKRRHHLPHARVRPAGEPGRRRGQGGQRQVLTAVGTYGQTFPFS